MLIAYRPSLSDLVAGPRVVGLLDAGIEVRLLLGASGVAKPLLVAGFRGRSLLEAGVGVRPLLDAGIESRTLLGTGAGDRLLLDAGFEGGPLLSSRLTESLSSPRRSTPTLLGGRP